jgi:hypothetical protein
VYLVLINMCKLRNKLVYVKYAHPLGGSRYIPVLVILKVGVGYAAAVSS